MTERTISNPTMLYRGLERSRTLQVLLSVIWKHFGDKELPFRFHKQIHHTRQADNYVLHNNFFQTNKQAKSFPFIFLNPELQNDSALLIPFDFSAKTKKSEKLRNKAFLTLSGAGDERIELPPKVLETPIIPLDQSPIFCFVVHHR